MKKKHGMGHYMKHGAGKTGYPMPKAKFSKASSYSKGDCQGSCNTSGSMSYGKRDSGTGHGCGDY